MNKLYRVPPNSSKNSKKDISLIFVHGNSQNTQVWEHQLNSKELQSYNLIAFDLPGHGKSYKLEAYSIKNIIKVLTEEIDKEEDYVLIGHSLGGHFCIQALPKLRNCLGLLLCGTPPLRKPLNLNEAFIPDERMTLLFQENLNTNEVETLADYISSSKDSTTIKSAIKQSDGKFRKDMGLEVSNEKLQDELGILLNSKLPIGIVVGEYDGLVNKSYIQDLGLNKLWGNKAKYIKKAGHSPHLEKPQVFNKLVLEFINNI